MPELKSDLKMNVSMQAYRGRGSRIYGLMICEGVCCDSHLTPKSTAMTKGMMPSIISRAVVLRLEFTANANITAKNIR